MDSARIQTWLQQQLPDNCQRISTTTEEGQAMISASDAQEGHPLELPLGADSVDINAWVQKEHGHDGAAVLPSCPVQRCRVDVDIGNNLIRDAPKYAPPCTRHAHSMPS